MTKWLSLDIWHLIKREGDKKMKLYKEMEG